LPSGSPLQSLLGNSYSANATASAMRIAADTFPNVDFRPVGGPAATAGQSAGAMPAGNALPTGLPGAPTVPLPPTPFAGNTPGPAAPPVLSNPFGAGAPFQTATQTQGPVANALDAVRSLIAPPPAATTPSGLPVTTTGTAGAAATALADAATAPARALGAGVLQATGVPVPTSVPAAAAANAQAGALASAPQTAAATAAQTPPVLQQAAQIPTASAPPPQRNDGVVPPAMATERAAVPNQAPPPAQTAAPTSPAGATLLAAVPLAAATTQLPAGQTVAGNPQIAGNPQATAPVAGELGGPSRAELTATGVYTADGPGLRRRTRLRAAPEAVAAWMLALTQGRLHLVRPHDDTPREVARAMQWVFWTLALVAYGCLALVIAAFLLSAGDVPAGPAMRQWSGELALAGLVAAAGAWWLARKLTAPPVRGRRQR